MFSHNKKAWYLKPVPSPSDTITESPTFVGLFCTEMSGEVMGLIHGAISNLFEDDWFEDSDTWTKEETAQFFRNQELIAMNICQLIADCLSDPTSPAYIALQDAIQNNTTLFPPELGTGDGSMVIANTVLIEECDLAILYGLCRQIVDFLDTTVWDFLQILETLSNPVEKLALTTGAIPMVGAATLANGLAFADKLEEDIAENYLAQVTEGFKVEATDKLFCIAKRDCNLTFEELVNFLQVESNLNLENVAFQSFLIAYTGYGFTGNAIVYGAWSLIGYFLSKGASVFGLSSVTDLALAFKRFSNDADADYIYAEECPTCTQDNVVLTFSSSSSDANEGNWSSSVADGNNTSPYSRYVDDELDSIIALGATYCVSRVKVHIYQANAQEAIRFRLTIEQESGIFSVFLSNVANSAGNHHVLEIILPVLFEVNTIRVLGVGVDNEPRSQFYVHYVEVYT